MADRLDFFFRQRVTEAELDLAFEQLDLLSRGQQPAAARGFHGHAVNHVEPDELGQLHRRDHTLVHQNR